jgi:4-hydroxy-tetrahydrodipicolinate synthase
MSEGPALRGVVPANLMPFDAELRIDEPNLRRHLRDLADTPGVAGVTTNAHASEVATLTLEEQQRSLQIAVDEIAGKVPVICGIYEDGSNKAAALARMAEREGADFLLVFPSAVFAMGSQQRPEMAFAHYATVAEATSLPMVVFAYPAGSGLHLETDNLARICAEIDNVAAVKEWTNDIVRYERNLRALKALDKPIAVLSSFSTGLLASLCVGADGILSGHGSVIADLHVALFEAVERSDLEAAGRLAARIYPLTRVFYDDPFVDGHNRMKEALVLLGRIDEAHVRPPLQRIPAQERERIAAAVAEAGLPRGRMAAPAGA